MRMCDFFLDQATQKLNQQIEWANDVDTKLSILLGIGGVLLATVLPEDRSSSVAIAATVALLGSMVLALAGYGFCRYEVPPDLKHLWETYYQKDEVFVKETLTSNLVKAAQANERALKHKARWARCSHSFLTIGVFLTVLTRFTCPPK